MMTLTASLERMAQLNLEKDPLRKKLVAFGILSDQLAPQGIVPVLVGGSAVEFYTAGGYASKDVDLAMPSSEAVDRVFSNLGFRKEGRYWIREDLDLLFEAPTADLAGEDAPLKEIEIDGMKISILGIEDLLIDRLRAWVHWKSEEDGRWTRRLAALYADTLDWKYVYEKTASAAGETAAVKSLDAELRKR